MSKGLIARRAWRDCDICIDYEASEPLPWVLWVFSDDPQGVALPANHRSYKTKADALAEAWRLYGVRSGAFVNPAPPAMPAGGLFDADAMAQGDLLEGIRT